MYKLLRISHALLAHKTCTVKLNPYLRPITQLWNFANPIKWKTTALIIFKWIQFSGRLDTIKPPTREGVLINTTLSHKPIGWSTLRPACFLSKQAWAKVAEKTAEMIRQLNLPAHFWCYKQQTANARVMGWRGLVVSLVCLLLLQGQIFSSGPLEFSC